MSTRIRICSKFERNSWWSNDLKPMFENIRRMELSSLKVWIFFQYKVIFWDLLDQTGNQEQYHSIYGKIITLKESILIIRKSLKVWKVAFHLIQEKQIISENQDNDIFVDHESSLYLWFFKFSLLFQENFYKEYSPNHLIISCKNYGSSLVPQFWNLILT
jgi:hypothetical protein